MGACVGARARFPGRAGPSAGLCARRSPDGTRRMRVFRAPPAGRDGILSRAAGSSGAADRARRAPSRCNRSRRSACRCDSLQLGADRHRIRLVERPLLPGTHQSRGLGLQRRERSAAACSRSQVGAPCTGGLRSGARANRPRRRRYRCSLLREYQPPAAEDSRRAAGARPARRDTIRSLR